MVVFAPRGEMVSILPLEPGSSRVSAVKNSCSYWVLRRAGGQALGRPHSRARSRALRSSKCHYSSSSSTAGGGTGGARPWGIARRRPPSGRAWRGTRLWSGSRRWPGTGRPPPRPAAASRKLARLPLLRLGPPSQRARTPLVSGSFSPGSRPRGGRSGPTGRAVP